MYTNCHTINEDTFQLGMIDIPDKYSYREEIRRRNGFLLRLYWQFQETLNHGTIVFDTLTYSDDNLPHVSDYADFGQDFSCFNPDHIKYFLDKLHSRLSYYGMPTFKHFISSEYGSDSMYVDWRGRTRKATHRPHYHVLFFFDGVIDPVWLSRQVHECWSLGRTDNFGNHGEVSRADVLYNAFNNANTDSVRILKLSNYLSKYVLKDAKYSRRVDFMVKQYVRRKYPHLELVTRKAFNHDVNELRSRIAPFIRVSNHFGEYFCPDGMVRLEDWDLIQSRSMMRIPDSKTVWKYIPIPTYYLRKLFYKCKDGRWVLNSAGKFYYHRHLRNRVDRLQMVYNTAYLNASPDVKDEIDSLLDGRSFSDVARYAVYYRHRIYNPEKLDGIPDVQFVNRRIVDEPGRVLDAEQLYTFYRYSQYEYRRRYYETYDLVSDEFTGYMEKNVRVLCSHKHYDHSDDWHRWIIDSSWFPDHYGFDDVIRLLQCELNKKHITGQYKYDFTNQLALNLHAKFGARTDA